MQMMHYGHTGQQGRRAADESRPRRVRVHQSIVVLANQPGQLDRRRQIPAARMGNS